VAYKYKMQSFRLLTDIYGDHFAQCCRWLGLIQ